MSDPILALYRHVMKNELFLPYIDDPEEYASNSAYSEAALKRLQTLLDDKLKQELTLFLDMRTVADSLESEAIFTAGLAAGLQLLQLV